MGIVVKLIKSKLRKISTSNEIDLTKNNTIPTHERMYSIAEYLKFMIFLSIKKPSNGEKINVNSKEKVSTSAAVFWFVYFKVKVKKRPEAIVSLKTLQNVAKTKKIGI